MRGGRPRHDVSRASLLLTVDHRSDKVVARAPAFENRAGDMERDQCEQAVGDELMDGAGSLAGGEGRGEGKRPGLQRSAEYDDAGQAERGNAAEKGDDHRAAERVVADVTRGGAAPQFADVQPDPPRPVHESREAGGGWAEEAPDYPRQNKRHRRRTRNDMERHPSRRQNEAGDESDGDCADQAPVEETDERVPDRRGAGAGRGVALESQGAHRRRPRRRPETGVEGNPAQGKLGGAAIVLISHSQPCRKLTAPVRLDGGRGGVRPCGPRRRHAFCEPWFTLGGRPESMSAIYYLTNIEFGPGALSTLPEALAAAGNHQAVPGQRPWPRGERAARPRCRSPAGRSSALPRRAAEPDREGGPRGGRGL